MTRRGTLLRLATTAALVAILVALPPPSPMEHAAWPADPTSGPASGARGMTTAAPDAARTAAGTPPNITWQASEDPWPGDSPAGLTGAAMAWDPRDGYLVLFGGNSSEGPVANTWTFEAGGWTNRTNLSDTPPAMFGASMDFDYALDSILLFGGCGPGACPSSSTWLYAGGTWQNATDRSIDAPPARFDASLGFANDSVDHASVLFGGCLNARCTLRADDTWVLNTTVGWVPETIVGAPPTETGAPFTYDPPLGGLILFGGCVASGCAGTNATWLYTAGTWSDLSASIARPLPPADPSPAASFDATDGQLWVIAGPPGAPASTWSLGCQGSSCHWSNRTASVGTAVLPSQGAAIATESGALPPVLVGGAVPGGPATPSRGTWVLELPLNLQVLVQSLNAPARSPVQGSANATGGTPPYEFIWSVAGVNVPSENVTLSFPSPGSYEIQVAVLDAFGARAQASVTEEATGPSVVATASPGTTDIGVPVTFTAAPPAGGTAPYNFTWLWPDATESFGAVVLRSFASAGAQSVGILVTDARGVTNLSHLLVQVVGPPSVMIASPLPATDAGGIVNLSATVSGGVGPVTYNWTFGGAAPNASGVSVQPRFRSPGPVSLEVRATDALGVSATAWLNLTVHPALGLEVVGVAPPGWGPSAGSLTNGTSFGLEALPQNGTAGYSVLWRLTDPGGTVEQSAGPWLNGTLQEAGDYAGIATVTDATGATANASFAIVAAGSGSAGCSSCPGVPDPLVWEIVIAAALALAGVAGVMAAARSKDRDR